MNVTSFSIYGNVDNYINGAIKNAEMKKDYFPDWEMRIYHDSSLSLDNVKKLEKYDVRLVNIETQKDGLFYPKSTKESKTYGMFWRFLPASDPSISYFTSRDCDSRFSEREVCAVNEWMESGKPFHIIRDHPIGHASFISGGMWGSIGGFVENISDLIKNFVQNDPKTHLVGADQYFLRERIYPSVKNHSFVHDEYFRYEKNAVPIKRDRKLDDFAFIGEPIDNENHGDRNYRLSIIERYKQK